MLLDLLLSMAQRGGLSKFDWGSFGSTRGGTFLPGGFSESGLVLAYKPFQRVPKIAPQVPSIRRLLCLRSAVSGSLSVRLGTVATEDLDAWMGA